jgi:hypothetical protein
VDAYVARIRSSLIDKSPHQPSVAAKPRECRSKTNASHFSGFFVQLIQKSAEIMAFSSHWREGRKSGCKRLHSAKPSRAMPYVDFLRQPLREVCHVL